jgi:two-component system, sensor histidine kinase and response regulator
MMLEPIPETNDSPTTSATPTTVLVVEDNDDLRDNAALVLSLEGYKVMTAFDGQDALELLARDDCHIDLIVSDIAMPRLDGYGFFEAVRAIPSMRATPFIFLTARGSRRDIRFGKELGVDDYLVKPFNSEDFIVAVKNKLRRTQEIRTQASAEAATELDDARRAMVQLMSHELRTPLTYVTGGFSLLAEGLEADKLPDDMKMSMSLIRSGTQRLNHLAEQLVMYAELISGHSKLQMKNVGAVVDLLTLVRNVIQQMTKEQTARKITFTLEDKLPHAVEVFTVSEIFNTALYEVVRNAATFSPEGSEVTIRLSLEPDEKFAVVQVIDHGRGIAQGDQAKIWDIMIQSDRLRHEQQGAGMGLPITKQIMLLHGGTADLTSELKVGTTVTLRFPVHHHDA